MKQFSEYTDEQLAEWRADDITRAFAMWLTIETERAAQAVIDAVRTRKDFNVATHYTGQLDAFDKAWKMAMRETT